VNSWTTLTLAAKVCRLKEHCENMLIGALANPSSGAQLEGLNYFADTLLFGGTILSLAQASSNTSLFTWRN
jgi:hypothetical protein